jgi:predicted ArsR family transcriptional regulator
LSEIRQCILFRIKELGSATIGELSETLNITYEATRQQISQMEREGWLSSEREPSVEGKTGRPSRRYRVSLVAEHVFPKHYDALTIEMISIIVEQLGTGALHRVLETFTEARVKEWKAALEGLPLEKKIEKLKDIYFAEDPFTSVESSPDGPMLIEKNCPFLNVATHHPALCSVTVNTLTRLLGFKVERVERFQAGHGRCVFKVLKDKPVSPETAPFEFETP